MGERDDSLPPEYRPTEEELKVNSGRMVKGHLLDYEFYAQSKRNGAMMSLSH